MYDKQHVYQIYPEYWIIKAGVFDEKKVKDALDEWIYFFKTGEVKEEFTAPGLVEAKDKLNKLKLTPTERKEYEEFIDRLRKLASYQETEMEDVKDLIKEAKAEQLSDFVIELWLDGTSLTKMAKYAKISEEQVAKIIEKHKSEI
jgi:hypothetical protein